MLYFITGNKNKFEEIKAIISETEQLDIDLPEIQEIDAREIIKQKLLGAFKFKKGEFIVEDTSLYLDFMNGLPGPLIKWFLKTIGNEGIFKMAKDSGNMKAETKTIIGYAKNPNEIFYFKGAIKGIIVAPRGDNGFGFDPIFQPEGFNKTFAEMDADGKNAISMRKIAASKLKEFLEK